MKNLSSLKFRKILNDLKRRPEDAAEELGVTESSIQNILQGKEEVSFELIKKAVSVWPVNYSDFFFVTDDTKNDYKIFRSSESNTSKRKMYRNGKPYYLYKDTVMSKISSFRPEWIQQLSVVNDDSPDNPDVVFNNGHFLHQFTYFIGPVNFYYVENGVKKIAKMNTGDSMYIGPYIPHTFTTRKNDENILGHILALTYSDKVDSENINEVVAIGKKLSPKFKINSSNEVKAFKENLIMYLKASSITKEIFQEFSNLNLDDLLEDKNIPNFTSLKKISNTLDINLRDLLPPIKNFSVKIKRYNDNKKWFYPSSKSKFYSITELASVNQLPNSKSLELTVLTNEEMEEDLEVPRHQYLYNIGDTETKIKIDKKIIEKFSPGDSIYMKPNIKHKFIGKSKILILRIGGKISGDVLYQLSMVSDENFSRLIEDNQPWFNK
jgi:transcriptional regulator with XRE-family HTH domain